MTTGSLTPGCVPGLTSHLGPGRGMSVVTVEGNPSGILSPVAPGTSASNGVSGACVAYDSANDQLYKHLGGTANALWIKLGSVQ